MTSKDFESTARELRDAIAKAKGGRRNVPVPSVLRARAIVLAESQRAAGASMRETAAALGLHETTLMAWRRTASSPFVAARIVADECNVDVPRAASAASPLARMAPPPLTRRDPSWRSAGCWLVGGAVVTMGDVGEAAVRDLWSLV